MYTYIHYTSPASLSRVISYEVATISRLPKNTRLFCKRALQKRLYSAKETYTFKEATNHSHPICSHACTYVPSGSSLTSSPVLVFFFFFLSLESPSLSFLPRFFEGPRSYTYERVCVCVRESDIYSVCEIYI